MLDLANTLTILFGIFATVLGIIAIWIARKQHRTLAVVPDTELGLLQHAAASTSSLPLHTPEDNNSDTTNTSTETSRGEGNQLYHMIGDALEVFSRHLRALN